MSDYCKHIDVNYGIRLDVFTPTSFRVRRSTLSGEPFPDRYEIPFAVGHTDEWKEVSCQVDGETYPDVVAVTTPKLKIYVRCDTASFVVETIDGDRLYPTVAPRYGMFCNHCIMFDSANFWQQPTDVSRYAHWFFNPQTERYDTFLKEDALLDTFFIYAETYRDGYRRLREVVGAEPMLTRKGYGYYQMHDVNCDTQAMLTKTAQLLREHDIPCDTLIVGSQWGDSMFEWQQMPLGSGLDWSSAYREPYSPEDMLHELNVNNFDVLTVRHSAPVIDGCCGDGKANCLFDKDLWREKLFAQLNQGVSGVVQDTRMADVTNGWIFDELAKNTNKRVTLMSNCDVYLDSRRTKDAMITPRKQKIGGRRYPFFWTGECATATWQDLAFQVESIVNANGALGGMSYLACDGFRGSNVALAVRCDQFLAFNSVCMSGRLMPWQTTENTDDSAESDKNPNTYANNTDQESLLLLPEAKLQQSIVRSYLKLRYALLPYIYTAARNCYDTGLPITRPLMVQFESDDNCNRNQYPCQYMFGNDVLVCPVVTACNTMRVYLPSGCSWVDMWTEEKFDGGQELMVDVSDLSKMPLFVRNGAVIPMQKPCNWIAPVSDEIIFKVFGDEGGGRFYLYEDDGESLGYANGKSSTTDILCVQKDGKLYLTIFACKGKCPVEKRKVTVAWKGRQLAFVQAPNKTVVKVMK